MITHADAGCFIYADQTIGTRLTGNHMQVITEQVQQILATSPEPATGAITEQDVVFSTR